MAEEHVPVDECRGRVRQLLETDDVLVTGRTDPAAGLDDPAPGRGVVRDREDPPRGILDYDRDTDLDQKPGVRRHDGCAMFTRPHLVTHP